MKQAPDALAFAYPQGEGYGELTWRQVHERVFAIAGGLRALGLGRGESCAVLSSTRMEWVLADLAINCAGGVTATIYPANTPAECAHILTDSAAKIAFVEDEAQLAKLLERRPSFPELRAVVGFTPLPAHGGWVHSLEALEERGRQLEREQPGRVLEGAKAVRKADLATVIYTSGTTGTAKGVELAHQSWVAVANGIDSLKIVHPSDHQYLWLPLSHAFGKLLLAAQLRAGFSSTVDGRIPQLIHNMARVRPTFMAAPPRIFEKLYNRVVSTTHQSSALRQAVFRWALRVGRRASALGANKREPGPLLGLQLKIADRLVFRRVRELFGGRLRFFICGSAPLSREIAEFFHSMGLLILEGYGLTEAGGASSANRPDSFQFGTVGIPFEGVSVRLADDGELLISGPAVMRGYRNLPEDTAKAIDAQGWLHTGDIGEQDSIGRLRITDRKKDLIKTSGGKYVAPSKLENALKALSPYVGHVLVHGDRRNFCTALITLDVDSIAGWRKEHGLEHVTYTALSQHPEVVELIQQAIDELNAKLASYETIKRFALLPHELTVESGELTPSMKVKRRVVEQKYKDLLDGMYSGAIEEA